MLALLAWYIFSFFVTLKAEVAGIPVIALAFLMAAVAYGYWGVGKKKLGAAMKCNPFLTLFVIQGLVWLGLSYLGFTSWFPGIADFGVDLQYAPRHAYYLAVLPLIALAPYASGGEKVFSLVKKYGLALMGLVFIGVFIVCKRIFVTPSMLVLMGFLSLVAEGDYKIFPFVNWGVFAALMILPYGGYGMSTIILLKGAYFVFFLGKNLLKKRQWILYCASALIPVILVATLVLPLLPSFQLPGLPFYNSTIDDGNDQWRLNFWKDEEQALLQTYGVGVGFGTAYVSDHSPMLETGEFSREDLIYQENPVEVRPYVIGPHNSFMNVAFRQGALGILLFTGFLVTVWLRLLRYREKEQFPLAYLFCGGVVAIFTNNGLESPVYLIVFLFALYMVCARLYRARPETASPSQAANP
jgi:hypothetical protein